MVCWICNINEADSGEHKFKSSILKGFHGKEFRDEILLGTEKEYRKLRGVGSNLLKFPRVICSNCNNSVTASHDKSFDKLMQWVFQNSNEFREASTLNLEKIFGANWKSERLKVKQFIAKHAGCKIVTGNKQIPTEALSNLILKGKDTNRFKVRFVVKHGLLAIHFMLAEEDGMGLKYTSNNPTMYKSNPSGSIKYLAGMTTYNWLSFAWVYVSEELTPTQEKIGPHEPLIHFPIEPSLNPEQYEDWLQLFDNQKMETADQKIKFYDSLI